MENTETTTQEPQTTSPAPVADKAPVATPAAVAAPSAPAEAKDVKPSGTNDAQKGPADFFKQREAKREKKAQERVTELEKELAELREKASAKPAPQPEPEPLFSLDDPEGSFKKMKEQAAADAVKLLEERQAEAVVQGRYIQAAEGAEKFLLTRSHLKEDPNLVAELEKVIGEKYLRLAAYDGGRDPMAAARLAYLDVCAAKGITPDLDGFAKPTPMQATGGKATSGVSPSAPAGGKKSWSRAEAEKYLMEGAKSGQLQTRRNEIEEAKREGRIK